ncbi:3378_t:CDS:10 [Funneliformis geosporum]|uniref:20014_t:CDS:1 n=1 Tax=Funneliformis geosporum TaxID=1117311 RepID=A0A9W4SIT9_9GLOM|nr:3378_t:CDS:10 [Funneliformis geosporum]CAI2170119.1 20014_t:CDS:10 [Funneliformis geosporum]
MAEVSQEALNKLLDMGFERSKAYEALLKCGDVDRAVEYYFNINSGDDMMANLTTLIDPSPQTPNEWNESTTPRNDSDSEFNHAINVSMNEHKDYQRALSESLETRPQSTSGGYECKALNDNDQRTDDSFNNWSDPVQPMKRMNPLGLKSITHYSYAGSLFQALFHIPIFRLSILAYRPTRKSWGEVEGYWNGTSMALQVEDDQMTSQSSDFLPRSYTLKFMHECQKLFGFLSLSKRTYGDAFFLMSALDYQDNKIWNDWEASVQEFVNKLLSVIVRSSTFRNLIKLESEIPETIEDFGLLKSHTRNETIRKYDDYNYQPERKDEEVLKITPSCNTIYAAFDRKVRSKGETMHKLFFTEIAKILILNVKHCDGYTDNSFTSSFGSSGFQFPRELYMDRYMLNKADDVERRWQQLESLKSELENINQDIKKITEFQGRHDGSDLLKGSIDYFRRKCDKTSDNGDKDDKAQKICSFLEGVLDNVEQKLRVLLEKKDEIDGKIKDIFDTPDMKSVVYRLKAVLMRDCQFGQGRSYAYIRCNKTEPNYSSNDENGSWWKFCDTTVSETSEDKVLNDMTGSYVNSGVYTLIYVDADFDYNVPEINDVIDPSLKDFVEKDNRALDDVVFSNNDHVNIIDNQDEIMNNNTEDTHDEYMNNQGEWNSDSTYSGGNEELNDQKIMQKIDNQIEITISQAENMVSIHPKINKRFEIFCIKLEQIDLFKSLMHKYYDTNHLDLGWDDPSPLDTRYRDVSPYKEYVELFNKYKKITLYFVEGLERIKSDEYNHALVYLKHAINLENEWINQLVVKDENGNSVTLHGEKLRRSNEIDAYARACLKIIYEGVLNAFTAKYLDIKFVKRGLEDALRALPLLVGYLGASNCTEDELFKQLKNQLFRCLNEHCEDQELLLQITEKYNQPDESLKLKSLDDSNLPYDEYSLCERYNTLLKDCSNTLKKYDVPYIQ